MAPEPSRVNGPERGQPLREIPGLPRRERTWKDEVRERVAARRRRRASAAGERPLDAEPAAAEPEPARPVSVAAIRPAPTLWDVAEAEVEAEAAPEPEYTLGDVAFEEPEPAPAASPLPAPPPAPPRPAPAASRAVLDDLPLMGPAQESVAPPADDLLDEADEGEWELDLTAPRGAGGQVERPAYPGERLAAASLDGILLTGLAAVVLYFASRAAQTPVAGLAPSWPWLAAYLGFLALAYSACFTGVTGQTPGKMWAGLRVVGSSGAAPGAWSAGLRAALGAIGVVCLGLGLVPMFLDPARRALHDRVFGTRVVRR